MAALNRTLSAEDRIPNTNQDKKNTNAVNNLSTRSNSKLEMAVVGNV
jgi:hypothetical protein